MAFSIRQGLDSNDAVMTVYDPCPVVTYESSIASLFDVRYTLVIEQRVSGAWVQLADLKRFPNQASCGVFDMGPVLRNAIDIYNDNKQPPAGQAATNARTAGYFRIRAAYEYRTSADGTLLNATPTDRYVRGIAGRHLDQFTAWKDRPIHDFVFAQDQGKRFMSLRTSTQTSVSLAAQTYFSPVYVDLHRDERFSISYLSTDANNAASGFDTDAMRIRMRFGNASTSFGTHTLTISNQQVSNTTFHGENTAGEVVRNVHVGPADLVAATWASGFTSSSPWDVIIVTFEAVANSAQLSNALVIRRRKCAHQGMKFLFLNNLGGWDTLHCEGHTARSTQYTRQTHISTTGNWATANGLSDSTDLQLNQPQLSRTKSEVTNEKQVHTTHTGYLDDTHNDLVHGLLRSKRVYASRFDKPRQNSDNNYYPVNILNSNVKSMFREVEKLVDYTIEFEYANPLRPTI